MIYTLKPLRSIRGVCKDSDPVAALGLSPEDAAGLLPLKPFQCVVVIDEPFLVAYGGRLLVDNLYLLLRNSSALQDVRFVSTLSTHVTLDPALVVATLFLTNVTFHSGGQGSVTGVNLELKDSSALMADCIFTDWAGIASPVVTRDQTFAAVLDTVFYRSRLRVEVVDVSYGGTVHLRNVSFADVELTRGAVVSTTFNDYEAASFSFGMYYEEDDDAYDVEVTEVPTAAAGVFGSELRVEDAVMSDCVYLMVWPADTVLPGCPVESVRQRERVWERVQVDATGGTYDVESDDRVLRGDPAARLAAGMLQADDPWLVGTRAALPRGSTPQGALRQWPAFVLDPPPQRRNRSSLRSDPGPLPAGALLGSFTLSPPPIPLATTASPSVGPAGTSATAGDIKRKPWVVVLLVVLICATLLCAASALCWFLVLQKRRRRAVAAKVAQAEAAQHESWRTTQAAAGSGPVRNIHIGDTSPSQPPTAASSYVAAMLTHGGTISGSDIDDLDLLPPLAGLDSLASLPRGGSLARSSVPADGSRRNGSISFGISLNPDPSLRHEGSLRHDQSVPDSALNPAYDYALPPSLALIAPEPERSATSEHLYNTMNLIPTTDDAGGGGESGDQPSDTGEMLAARLPASLLHHGAHTLVHAAAAAGRASRGAARMTEPAGGAAVAALAHASSLDARSDCMSGSTIVMSPFTVSDVHSTHSSQNTDVYVPCGATTSTPCAIPEDAEVLAADLPPPPQPPPRAAWPPHGAATEHSTGQHTTSTMSTAYPHSSSNLGLSTTDALLVDENIRLLLRQLDCFRERHLFLKRFVMLGREGRRRGGQAVVQFCRDSRDDCHYAIKFFLDHDAFVTEASLFAACFPALRTTVSPEVHARADATIEAADSNTSISNVPLSEFAAQFLPQVDMVCDSATEHLVDPRGRALPPCIIMEKGESLQDWSNRAEPDLFTSLAVLSNISQRLADMHAAGYVHRDLKPANVMWLPRENRWTVIDFGCVARVGEQVSLSFTLAYAAPEVVHAVIGSQKKMVATPMLDAWSLGVMAFELLTGAPAFKMVTEGRFKVVAMLKGELPLPWEGDLDPGVHKQLGAFKGLVLQLLQRNPRRRVSLRHFHHTCTRLFDSRTTIEA